MLLELNNVSCSVPGRTLFRDLSFKVDKGESLAIIGPSGVGKSTLVSAILGLREVDEGEIRILGKSITSAKPAQRVRLRREHIGFVHQDGQLIDELSAEDNVATALMLMDRPPKDPLEQARSALREAGVPPGTLAAKLSGGERQRTAVVRAMVSNPDLLIADEPTGSLDSEMAQKIATMIFELSSSGQVGLVLVTHDADVAARADRILDLGAAERTGLGAAEHK